MILQALREYYEREACDPNSSIAPFGWEWKEIPFLLILNENGRLVQVEDTREMAGKKLVAKSYLVPKSVKRTVGIAANLLWDNVEYVTGVPCKEKDTDSEEKKAARAQRVAEQHEAFLSRVRALASCASVQPIISFFERPSYVEELNQVEIWKEACESCAFISFRIAGHAEPVFREADIVEFVDAEKGLDGDDDLNNFVCLDGCKGKVALLHPSIKGVWGTNTTGGNLVSFNFPAACSFGKSQGENSPVSEKLAFQYTTALNDLLSKKSRQRMQVGDATMVFWASRPSPLEALLPNLFAELPPDVEETTEEAVKRLLSSVQDGRYVDETSSTKFYVLGLSPNSARISVRFWQIGTVAEMEERFCQWFEDLQIVHGPKDKDHLSLWRLLVSTASQGKTENVPPNLAGNVMRSILSGTPLPETLLGTVLLRVKADQDVSYPRVKLIKAFLLRKWRIHNKERSLTMSLDKNNANIGYRLGRLFAVLEKIQQEANPGINATIRDKFYAAASSTPVSVFGNLMRLKNHHLSKLDSETRRARGEQTVPLKNHHLSKLDSEGRVIYFERLLGEIIYQSEVGKGVTSFPSHLSLEDQGLFAIGYYQQRQDMEDGANASNELKQDN